MVKVTINENLCKGCGLCVRACPKGVLALAKDKLNAKGYHPSVVANPEACIGCTSCAHLPGRGNQHCERLRRYIENGIDAYEG